MLSLKIPKDPYWLELGMGVRVQVRPLTSDVMFAAQAKMQSKLALIGEEYKRRKELGLSLEDLPNLEDKQQAQGVAEKELIRGLAHTAILAWEGVLEADSDELAKPTPEKIDELLTFWVIAERFRLEYTGIRELLEAEKKPCMSGASGTSETVPPTAATAGSKTSTAPEDSKTNKADNALTSSTT